MDSAARRLWIFLLDHSVLLLVGAVMALVWANIGLPSYERLAHAIRFAVNDVGMAFFFALAAKEVVEATAPRGALHSPRRAAMPLVAAIGGMAGPAVIYVALTMATGQRDLLPGWAIPSATDIAFSYLAARIIFGPKHPAIPFLLLLAIADDAFGLVILTAFYPIRSLRPIEFVVLQGVAIAVAIWLRQSGRQNFWPYILGAGLPSWFAFYRGGLHPALALVPIIPFVPHARGDAGLFVNASPHGRDPLTEFEHRWKWPVQGVLFFFGLANAGVPLSNTGAGTWIVLTSMLLGKPLGIVLFSALGLTMGLHHPAHLSWRDLIVLGCAAGIGFTVALFFATAAFPAGALLDQTKMGALFSFAAALMTTAVAIALRVGRWTPTVK